MKRAKKVIFIVGPPKSGKKTQIKRLCDEFGYKHIDVKEQAEATVQEESEAPKNGLTDEDIIQLIGQELESTKSNRYLITGFPRSLSQAILFETTFGEIHALIELDASLQAISERMHKAKIVDETIEQKINEYKEHVSPLLDYYKIIGKVRAIDGNPSPPDVYKSFVEAVLPQLYFLMGPRCSGKSTVCNYLAQRSNLAALDFKVLAGQKRFAAFRNDSEAITKELIKHLHKVNAPRLVVEGFPENANQLLCFLSNAIKPRNCIFLRASESSCLSFSTKAVTKCNIPSAVLCRLIKEFYIASKDIVKTLKKHKCVAEITNSEEISLEQLFETASYEFDPELLLIRNDEDSKEAVETSIKEMEEKLHYKALDVPDLIRREVKRNTAVGKEIIGRVVENKFISTEDIIKCLRKFLYTVDGHDKFLLLGFPEETSQLQLLESTCCRVRREFYFHPQQGEKIVRVGFPTIETYMHKTNRLIPLTLFNSENLERYYGDNLMYALVLGAPLSGKTTVAKKIEGCGFTLLDGLALAEEVKKKLATEDNPAEGINVTPDQLMEELRLRVETRSNKREKFVLDNFSLEDASVINKILTLLGPPAFFIELLCDANALKERYKKKNEVPELSEDQVAELDKAFGTYDEILKGLQSIKEAPFVRYCEISTETTEDLTSQAVKGIFEPNLILLTHDAEITTDDILANLSIKYDFLYVPLDSIIKKEVVSKSEMGQELKRTRKFRNVTLNAAETTADWEYNPMHYEPKLLLALVKSTVMKQRVDQKFVLVDGLLNSSKLHEEDKVELRAIDELLNIEKDLGEIKAILRLTQGDYEDVADDRVAVKLEVEEKQEEKKEEEKKEGEEEQQPPPAEPVEEEDKADKSKFKPEDYAWTDTEGKPRNLGQFFVAWKKCACKNILFNELHSGVNNELVLDSLLGSIISGQLSKGKTYIQVRYSL